MLFSFSFTPPYMDTLDYMKVSQIHLFTTIWVNSIYSSDCSLIAVDLKSSLILSRYFVFPF